MTRSYSSDLTLAPAVPVAAPQGLEFRHKKADNVLNKTRQGYARKRILKPAGYFFAGGEA